MAAPQSPPVLAAMDMPLHPSGFEITLRIALTCLFAGLIGLERETRGQAVGFRTTILVGLAAAVAMVQANLLLPLAGKAPNGFVNMDAMRLPLGILTGMGFIGGGAILRRGSLVMGVTTAATLWVVTVMGLSFGGGQLGLGVAAGLLTLFIVWLLKRVDDVLPQSSKATLTLTLAAQGASRELDAESLGLAALRLVKRGWAIAQCRQTIIYEIEFRGAEPELMTRLDQLAHEPGVVGVEFARAEEDA
jgi:putative Mg2+ transporter-C (MgtC) family protein